MCNGLTPHSYVDIIRPIVDDNSCGGNLVRDKDAERVYIEPAEGETDRW